jgi:hypothetical protein
MHGIAEHVIVGITATAHVGYHTALTIQLDRLAYHFFVILRRALHTQEVCQLDGFFIRYKRTLDALRLGHVSSKQQHVTLP